MTAPTSLDPRAARLQLIVRVDDALRQHWLAQPITGVECALIAAAVLVQDAGDTLEDLQDVARECWRHRHANRLTGVAGTAALLTVALSPDRERQRCAEHLLCIAQEVQAVVDPRQTATACLQVAAAWAATSLAVTEARWRQAVEAAWMRADGWFERVEEQTC